MKVWMIVYVLGLPSQNIGPLDMDMRECRKLAATDMITGEYFFKLPNGRITRNVMIECSEAPRGLAKAIDVD